MAAPQQAQIKEDGLTQTAGSPKVRTLHEPPDIWELVQETRTEFKPGSAFVGRLTSLHPLVLALILLIILSGAVFGFMTLRGRSWNQTAAPPAPTESGNPRTVLSPPTTRSNTTAPKSDQPANSARGTDPAVSGPAKIDEPKAAVAAPAESPGREVIAKPLRQTPTVSTTTTAATGNKDRAQASSLTKPRGPTAARTDNKDTSQPSITLGPKSDKEKSANPAPAKKQADKTLNPELIAPARTSATPKPKVIPWPND